MNYYGTKSVSVVIHISVKSSNLDFVNMIEYILLIIIFEFDSFLSEIILSDNLILISIWVTWMEAFDFDKITL